MTTVEDVQLVTTEVAYEKEMSRAEADSFINMLCNKWGIVDDTDKVIARNNVIWYAVKNGSSPYCAFSRGFTIHGVPYSFALLGNYRESYRRFCRANADKARALLGREDSETVTVRNERANHFKISPHHATLAFDFSEACTGLSLDEATVASNIKYKALAAAKLNRGLGGYTTEGLAPAEAAPPPPADLRQGNYAF